MLGDSSETAIRGFISAEHACDGFKYPKRALADLETQECAEQLGLLEGSDLRSSSYWRWILGKGRWDGFREGSAWVW